LFFEVSPYTQWNTVLKQFAHQLHHVPAAETSFLVRVQCSHVSTHHSAFLAGFTGCLNTTSVLSQARATARLDHSSCSRGDCARNFSSVLVFRLPLLYRCSKLVVRGCHHLSCNRRSTLASRTGGYPMMKSSLYYYEVIRISARSDQLHLETKQYCLGDLRVCVESAHVSALQAHCIEIPSRDFT